MSMRMMSYVYDIKNELHEMSKAKSALDVECARLHKDVARLTQKVADLEAVNREEKDQATAAQNTLQAKVDMMLQMMTKCVCLACRTQGRVLTASLSPPLSYCTSVLPFHCSQRGMLLSYLQA